MFENPGRSLKTFGTIMFAVGAIVSIWGGIKLFNVAHGIHTYYSRYSYGDDNSGSLVFLGIVCIIGGILVSYLLSLFLIAFAELVENSTMIRQVLSQPSATNSQQTPKYDIPLKRIVICPSCQSENVSGSEYCTTCGHSLK